METGDTVTLASDGERDTAVRVLSEAFAEGRLTEDEHGERVRAAHAARTWEELTRLTADLPDPADAAEVASAGAADGLDRCLLCALLIICPPAGIAWLLTARHRARASLRQSRGVARGLSVAGASGAAGRAGSGRHAEDR
jgi:hypothetical protein